MNRSTLGFVGLVTLPILFGLQCASGQTGSPGAISDETPKGAKTPLFVGISVHHRPITSESNVAQRYFDQGLNLMFAFNHDEAIRSFEEALRFDNKCAMASWGIALCRGPHINNSLMDEAQSKAAWEALGNAKSKAAFGSPEEKALIAALEKRYVADPKQNIENRETLNKDFAEAMRQVYEQFPDDTDVAVLYAESLMDLRPWDLWSDDGQPSPDTPTVLKLLETVMKKQPNHPGANHLYIHAVEASPNPEKGTAAADRLRTLMPGSGHMVHMPAHIDVRTGKWSLAADQNESSMKVDHTYREASPHQEFYSVYMLHNPHFLSFACMMEGRQQRALSAAREMLASVPPAFKEQAPQLVDPFLSIEYQVLVRFGEWDQLLKLPEPADEFPITKAIWRFARATAFAAKHEFSDAEREQGLFRDAVASVPAEAMGAINPASDILRVAEHVLVGEIAFQQGDIDSAVAELKKGVEAETKLLYMEPPEWIQPVRHSLGAVLVSAKRWDEAEQVYRDDLRQWPENGWALFGLSQCLRATDDTEGADEMSRRFEAAWKRADTRIGATCLCVKDSKLPPEKKDDK